MVPMWQCGELVGFEGMGFSGRDWIIGGSAFRGDYCGSVAFQLVCMRVGGHILPPRDWLLLQTAISLPFPLLL